MRERKKERVVEASKNKNEEERGRKKVEVERDIPAAQMCDNCPN